MKKITYILLLIFLSNCGGRTSKKQIEDVLEPLVDCELIGQQLEAENQFEKNNDERLQFVTIASYDINGDGSIKGKIILEKLQISWEEPGDFHRIRIEYKDTCYAFFNSSGWVKAESYIFEYVPNFTMCNKIQSDYIVFSKNGNDLLLFAFGYPYASQPGLLSIVNLSLKEPKLLFNDNCMLSGYQENKPNIVVTKFFKEDNINKHDTLLLKDHCLHKL
jgi:hypothetical protein